VRQLNYSGLGLALVTGSYEKLDCIKGWEFHDRASDCELVNGIEAWI
jgi:hypothetical protein